MSKNHALRDFGSRGVMVAALFTLTLFRWGMIIHGVTYFDDTSQQSPVPSPLSYNTILAQQSRRAAKPTLARSQRYPQIIHRQTVGKLYIDCAFIVYGL